MYQIKRQLSSLAKEAANQGPVMYARNGTQPPVGLPASKTVEKLSNGVTMACEDDKRPSSSLALVINAGSRCDGIYSGTTHMLKNSLIRAVPNDTITRTIRETELRGNTLYTSFSRENIVIASEFLRDDLVDAVPLLVDNLFNAKFDSYEFTDARSLVLAETSTALSDPKTQTFDLLHKVAFRHGLGNTLFAKHSHLKRAHLKHYLDSYLTADRLAVVGVGVNPSDLKPLLAEAFAKYTVSQESEKTLASTYHGGEQRLERDTAGHFAVGFKGVAYTDKLYPAALVLKALMDGGHIVHGSGGGLLCRASSKSAQVTAFNASYYDAGLLGIYVHGAGSQIHRVAEKSLSALKNALSGLSEAQLAGAKKAAIIDTELPRADRTVSIARQVLNGGNFLSPLETGLEISKVTREDVAKVLENALASKPSVATVGGDNLPYFDELKI